ncbi:MerR family transcriptional regulator [Spirochaetia bacterium]|nr:MerR family transcriptional regulator [Spirochaetia bacterium]
MSKYLIHDASQLSGVAPQTVRRYEDMGLIGDTRDDITGYRYFDISDIHLLLKSRVYRAYGFTLKETKELLDEKDIHNAASLFKGRAQAVEKEITWQKYILDHLLAKVRLLEEAKNLEHSLTLTTRPAMLGILMRRGLKITEKPKTRRCFSRWMKYMPLPQPFLYCDEDDSLDWEDRYSMGLCVTQEEADFLGFKAEMPAFYLAPCPCVYTVALIYADGPADQDNLSPILKKMAEQGLICSGPICGRSIMPLNRQTRLQTYFELWFPYKSPSST